MSRWMGPSRSAQVKTMKEANKQIAHLTGLPEKLLRLFEPNAPLPLALPMAKKAPKLCMTGISHLTDQFAQPGDPEYQPPRAENTPSSPRSFRNRELPTQARIDAETLPEK
jgi:hypothetical protein